MQEATPPASSHLPSLSCPRMLAPPLLLFNSLTPFRRPPSEEDDDTEEVDEEADDNDDEAFSDPLHVCCGPSRGPFRGVGGGFFLGALSGPLGAFFWPLNTTFGGLGVIFEFPLVALVSALFRSLLDGVRAALGALGPSWEPPGPFGCPFRQSWAGPGSLSTVSACAFNPKKREWANHTKAIPQPMILLLQAL